MKALFLLCCSLITVYVPMADPIQVTPTLTDKSLLRAGPGAFKAPRENNKKHTGVDIVANQSNQNKEIYKVRAVAAGIVAYARLNGSDEQGFGYTVIIDHQNGYYTQYSHLATVTSSGIVKKGDPVQQGQTIGYLADLSINEISSGNVRADVVKNYDKIQLHFEFFKAPTGRSSDAAIAPIKIGYELVDPTQRLLQLGYSSF